MEKINIELIKIFGPSILKVSIPKPIIDNLNNYIDKIILDKKKSKELDIGDRLVGDVTQEFELEQKIMQESGWGQFLSNCVSKWIELETKNKITKLALKGTKFDKLEDLFSGPTAVAFSEDAISSAKILTNFAKTNSNLKIIGGIMEDEPLSLKDVEKIATLPTLDEARAKIVGILATPAQNIMSILLAPGSKIAILAHAKSKKT